MKAPVLIDYFSHWDGTDYWMLNEQHNIWLNPCGVHLRLRSDRLTKKIADSVHLLHGLLADSFGFANETFRTWAVSIIISTLSIERGLYKVELLIRTSFTSGLCLMLEYHKLKKGIGGLELCRWQI
jgi:hypothetical protein